MKMTPFTKTDWLGYSGCKSDNPYISINSVRLMLEDYEFTGDVIADSKLVTLNVYCGDMEENGVSVEKEYVIEKEYKTSKSALSGIDEMSSRPDIEWLFMHGFRLVV